jgi:hypothetical protein
MNYIVTAGSDFLSVLDTPIASFDFGPPVGSVQLRGRPIGTSKNIHSVRQRLEDAHLPFPGSVATIPFEILSISLESLGAINVEGRDFNVFVHSTIGKRSVGILTLSRSQSDQDIGGAFFYSVQTFFTADFTPIDGGAGAFDVSSSLILGTEQPGTWSSEPAAHKLLIKGAMGDLRVNHHIDRVPGVIDFHLVDRVFEGRSATATLPARGGMVSLAEPYALGCAQILDAAKRPASLAGARLSDKRSAA